MRRILFLLAVLFGGSCFGGSAVAETVRLPVSRDLWISSASGEEEGNNGAAPRLKLKGYQEFSLLDFDLESLKGKKIKKATLHLKLSSDERLHRVGVSSITSDWTEGTGTNYAKESGASSFRWRKNSSEPWFSSNYNGEPLPDEYNDITSVIFGLGGSIWNGVDAGEPEDGWQSIDLDPDLVVARAVGLSHGFVIFDDTGTELERDGETVNIRLFPNRFLYSREQNSSCSPYLDVEFEETSGTVEPNAPINLSRQIDGLPEGAVRLRWDCSKLIEDEIVGFLVKIDGRRVPQMLIPSPKLGETPFEKVESDHFEALLTGLGSKERLCEITAVNRLGIESRAATLSFSPSKGRGQDVEMFLRSRGANNLPIPNREERLNAKLGNVDVSVVDEFVKFTENGDAVPKISDSYLLRNNLWDSSQRRVELSSARNEFIGFQIVFSSETNSHFRFELDWGDNLDSASKPKATFHRFSRVDTPKGKMIDPMIEFDCRQGASFLAGVDSAYCELFVPKDVAFGSLNGVLKIFDDNGRRLDLSIDLKVWNFSLPNELSFLPEMNCYSLPENELDYYRLAQLHRTYINRVPYSHRGTVADGLAPTWNMFSRSFDWSAWEKRFGRYFDGSAFADLPRGSVPIEAFYLPLFENFPANIFESFPYPDLWPEESAFSGDYCAVLRDGIKDFARKISREKWDRTKFLFFLNNKMDYKRDGWSRASSPWLLDEPASYRDFAALEFYGEQLKKSLAEISLDNAIQFRADISRPQWERNSLDSSLDVYVVGGGAFRDYRRTVLDRCSSYGRFLYTYGTTVSPEGNCYQPVLWTLDAWSLGADGIVPWQTIGNDNSWRVGDELALFYPAIEESGNCVVPSIRLKAYRRGQQDAEYLNLASKYGKLAREALSANLRKRLRLDETKNEIVSSEDAGTSVYAPVSPDDLISLRRELGEFLSNLDNKELSQ